MRDSFYILDSVSSVIAAVIAFILASAVGSIVYYVVVTLQELVIDLMS